MKKVIFSLAIIVIIGITASLGLLDATFSYDDISEQDYRISLKKATTIFKEKAHQEKVDAIQFIAKKDVKNQTNNTFEYLFIYQDQVVVIDPTTGKTEINPVEKTEKSSYVTFDIDAVSSVKTPQAAMKEALKQCGQKRAKAKDWQLLIKNSKLYYEVDLLDNERTQRLLIQA